MPRPRDSFKARVLNAEESIRGATTAVTPLQREAARVMRSQWFRKRNANIKSISVVLGRGTKCEEFVKVNCVIELDFLHATSLDLMHGIAHLLQAEDTALHGPEFARQYLDLTRRFLGQDRYKELDAAFKANDVKSRVWSPEAKDAAKARYAKNDLEALLRELST